jgi:hypothetical protein
MPPELPALPSGPLDLELARRLGLSDHQWRSARLRRVTRSVRSLDALSSTRERAAAYALALPSDAVFSHVTAAQLWGLPLPAELEAQVVLDVIRPTGRGLVERQGCHGHRGAERRSTTTVHGIRVTSLTDSWVDLGEVVQRGLDLDDLVIAADEVLARGGAARTSVGDPTVHLRRVLAGRVRPRNARLLGTALGLARPGVRSPMETRARLMFHRAGFPEPEVNAAVYARDGGWLAEGDLVWRAQRVIGEYQGSVHGGIRERSYDADRNGLLTDDGWRVLEIYADDVFRAARRRETVTRFARALGLDLSTLFIT